MLRFVPKLREWQDYAAVNGRGLAATIIGAVIAVIIFSSQFGVVVENLWPEYNRSGLDNLIPGGTAMLGIIGLLFMCIVVFSFLRR